MFFQESQDILESLEFIRNDHFNEIQYQIEILQLCLEETNAKNNNSISMSESIVRFRMEFDSLRRLFLLVLVPAVSRSMDSVHIHSAFNGFRVLRSLNEKAYKAIVDLKMYCNSFVLKEDWNDAKKRHCLTIFHLHTAFLEYINYVESTLIPLLKEFNDKPINKYGN